MENLVTDYRKRANSYIDEVIEEYGVDYAKDLLYRFAMAQLRDSLGFRPSPEELVLRISTQIQSEFGTLFEQFANEAFNSGLTEADINRHLKTWLLDFWKEKIG